MDIRNKAIAGCIIIILLFLIILVGISSIFMTGSYQELEDAQVTTSVDLVISRLQSEMSVLSSLAKNWAESDAMYAFAEGKNPGFIGKTLPPNTFQRYDINAIIFTNESGAVLFSEGYNSLTGKTEEVPPDILLMLCQEDCPFTDINYGGHTGLVAVEGNDAPAFFASYPILHSDRSGPVRGMVIIGKYLNADDLEKYRPDELSSLAITVVNKEDAVVPVSTVPVETLQRSAVAIDTVDDGTIRGTAFLNDYRGTGNIRLSVGIPRAITGQGRATTYGFILLELATGLVLGVFVLFLLDRVVLSRLQLLSKEIAAIASTGSPSARVNTDRDDEIGRLAVSMNRMLERIEDSQELIRRRDIRLNHAEIFARFGYIELNLQTMTASVSPGAQKILGLFESECALPRIKACILPRNREQFDTAIDELVTRNTPINREFVIRREQDSTLVTLHILAEYHPARHLIFSVIQDVTDKKHAELALKESEERYRTLIDSMPELVLVHRDGVILYVNATLSHGVGIPQNAMIGRSVFEFVTPETRDLLIRRGGVKSEQDPGIGFEGTFTIRGELRSGLVNAARITFEGEPATLVLITDITARKVTEEALSVANRKLQMLSSITRHDIRNKILGLRSYISIAMMSARDETERKLLRKMEDEARTIDEQIEFTREYQTMGLNAPQWLEVRGIVDRVAASLNLDKTVVRNETAGLVIFADPLLEKVFYNLFDNAIRYGETITEIHTCYVELPDALVLIVEDNGIGIPAENKQDIFDRGFGKNTGLGLFMIREILSITGMTICETGSFGRGARFEILVPRGGFRLNGSRDP